MANITGKIKFVYDLTRVILHSRIQSPFYHSVRGEKHWLRKTYRDLYERRLAQGPEKLRHRSVYPNWNYESEVFAFGARLGEDFKMDTLKTALTHQSYITLQENKRREAGVSEDAIPLNMPTNEPFIEQGSQICTSYIKAYLRYNFPHLPEEGISAIHDHLLSEDVLSHVSSNIGTADVTLCEDFPVESNTLKTTLLAVIGALAENQGVPRAQRFVQDLILTQLTGKLVDEMWHITNPMGLLTDICEKQGKSAPEPRLIWATGTSTVVAAYEVGIYSDRKLMGKGYGETVAIAEEMASRGCLRKLFGTSHNITPLNYEFSNQELLDTAKTNVSVKQIT